MTAHTTDCDGFGANHSPDAVRTNHGTYAPACSTCGELDDVVGSAGSAGTAKALAREQSSHEWGMHPCTGCVEAA